MSNSDLKYFKSYRLDLGFTSKQSLKQFFSAKDIVPNIDYCYLIELNERLTEIINKINSTVHESIRVDDISDFCEKNIEEVFKKLKEFSIIEKLNNQGRRPEQVYYSWMRGFVTTTYFSKAISKIFQINISNIKTIGDDDLANIESFRRTPTADLEISLRNGKKIRIEIQSGFQGINDIKHHKVMEAKRVYETRSIPTVAVHFDLFNGQAAFIRLDSIEDDSINWITRHQMEGQTVFNIDQNYFFWKLKEKHPKIEDLIRYEVINEQIYRH